jgi:hypothetical protein
MPEGAQPKFRKIPVASINSVGEGDETLTALSSAGSVGSAGSRPAAVPSLRIVPIPDLANCA